MKPFTPAAFVQQAEESEEQLVEATKAAIAKESECKFTIGQFAHDWTLRHAKGRTDEDFAKLVGLSRVQVAQRRNVFEKFGDVCNTYDKLSWSHCNVAIDWDDAAEWLGEAEKQGWSVATMKRERKEATVDDQAVDSTADTRVSVEGSNGSPHSDTVDVPNAAPPSRREGMATAKAEDTGRESRPPETEPSQAKRLVDQADSVARSTIPGIIEAGKSINEFLIRHERSGVDIEKMKSLSNELTGIFLTTKGEISKCK